MDEVSSADLLSEAAAELYAADPDVFVARRGELAARAREAGDKALARKIAALHKPTRSAWLVNQLSRTAPQAADQLADLGGELRAAQDSLDGAAIRDLSRQRRELLDRLTRQVFDVAGLRQPPAALRDEVTGTLGAAITDPQVAAGLRAGTLTKALQRAGLGDTEPDLAAALAGMAGAAPDSDGDSGGAGDGGSTVVRLPARRSGAGRDGARTAGSTRPGGRGAATSGRPGPAGARPGGSAKGSGTQGTRAGTGAGGAKRPGAQVTELAAAREKAARERRQKAIAEADHALAAADRGVRKTSRIERDADAAVRDLEAEVEDARLRLTEARQRLADARQESQRARTSQSRAQKALDRAQR
jgi:hypothetical protein